MRFSDRGEGTLILVIMASSGVLAAIINNTAVVALMLPVVMELARRTGRAPGRLLLPLAFGSVLGGMTTLIGGQSNILAKAERTI